LKDRYLRFHLDWRRGAEAFAELYDWRELHHIHCIARSFNSGAELQPAILGTVLIWPARPIAGDEGFDFADSYLGKNDACAVQTLLDDALARLRGPFHRFNFGS